MKFCLLFFHLETIKSPQIRLLPIFVLKFDGENKIVAIIDYHLMGDAMSTAGFPEGSAGSAAGNSQFLMREPS